MRTDREGEYLQLYVREFSQFHEPFELLPHNLGPTNIPMKNSLI